MIEQIISSVSFQKVQQNVQSQITPGRLIHTFLKHVDRYVASLNDIKGPSPSMAKDFMGSPPAGNRMIAGTVTVEGQKPNTSFPVYAFDSHGYFAGQGLVDPSTGKYRITNLSAGSYYIITWSRVYVDEIYPNQFAALGSLETWRHARRVEATVGVSFLGTNFNLERGTVISGNLSSSTGGEIPDATLSVTKASSPSIIFSQEISIVDGQYEVTIPGNGDYKLSAWTGGHEEQWYNGTNDWNLAEAVTISAGMTELQNIDFTLSLPPQGPVKGTISGLLLDPDGGSDYFILPIFAFNADDMTFSGYGIAMGLFGGAILEFSLEPGNYYLYAGDPTGGLMGSNSAGEVYMGVFYPSTPIVENATFITVNPGQNTALANPFILQHGGAITGRVTDPNGVGLDTLLVISVRKEGDGDENNPDFTQLQLSFGVTDTEGNYALTGLPSGDYLVRTLSNFPLDSLNQLIGLYLFPPAIYLGQFVDEYYGDIHNILDFENATAVQVAAPDTTAGINIQLDDVGFITGRVTNNDDGRRNTDVILLALNQSGYPEFTFGEVDFEGNYALGPLVSGPYKVLAISGYQQDHQYLTEFYNGARTFDKARVININAPQNTTNIDFTLDRGAIIQGYIDMDIGSGMVQAGADTLHDVPVIVYHANTGKVASYDVVQFNGGYRVDRLLPGNYKVCVFPGRDPFACGYVGGGDTFNDPNNRIIHVNYGDVANQNIEIGMATGSISGNVNDRDTQQPISGTMVIAYDQTGHAVSAAVSDTDFNTGMFISSDGSYRIEGLRNGLYYLRTFSLTSLMPLFESLVGLIDLENFDIISIVANPTQVLNVNIEAYGDRWYPDVTDVPVVDRNDIVDLMFNITSFGLPTDSASIGGLSLEQNSMLPSFIPKPYYAPIAEGAVLVQVTNGNETQNVDFELSIEPLEDLIISSVDENESAKPKIFSLSQCFPNPFNPVTQFTYSLPERDHVAINVYDVLGRNVRTLFQGEVQSGTYTQDWDGMDNQNALLPSGVYVIRFNTHSYRQGIKVTLIR